jgi:hypothetical protein
MDEHKHYILLKEKIARKTIFMKFKVFLSNNLTKEYLLKLLKKVARISRLVSPILSLFMIMIKFLKIE